MSEESFAKCEQIQTVPKNRLTQRKGKLSREEAEKVSQALKRTLDM
ncbi:hypothetical protein OP10G_2177 [Fimbriimonas ginsengisoli Gsoil 348]|uniref:Uncharacterized protein n=1 Tax=Fimbriimonas ginsengisoli Gsoil 348 TaxID=661478 RepID=A0A068NS39_FIMGI|nr:hypothetical protein OP10G_2177 [Fimbriimonas ginsengisoli Gsoil 348]